MEKGCCFTGHREVPEEEVERVTEGIRKAIENLHSDKGITTFYAGGCTGLDALAAKTVLEYQETHPEVRLIVVVPHEGQSRKWSQEDKDEYERIKSLASEVVTLANHYYNGCMQRRNRYMVDRSSECVCYLTREDGGTAFTVKYARAKGLHVQNLTGVDVAAFIGK